MHDRADLELPRPKFTLRFLATGGAVLAALGSAPAAQAGGKHRLDPTERRVIREVNRIRASVGLRGVTPSRRLARSADYHSRDMLRRDFFAHTSSNGSSFHTRVRRYSRAARIGENLAWLPRGRRGSKARQVVGMWMASPAHRGVVLSRDFRKIGVAQRAGLLGSMRATVFTADFSTAR